MWRRFAVIARVPVAGLVAQSAPIADREWKAGIENVRPRMLDAVARSYLVERQLADDRGRSSLRRPGRAG